MRIPENPTSLGEKLLQGWWIWVMLLSLITLVGLLIPRVIGQAALPGSDYSYQSSALNPTRNSSGANSVFPANSLAAPEQGPDLSIQKIAIGSFEIGPTETYSISVKSVEGLVTGAITVTDVLSDGLDYIGAAGQGWNPCAFTISNRLFTCVYSNTVGITTNITLPPLLMNVEVLTTTTPVITNTAVLQNASDINPQNNQSSVATVIQSADLAVDKSVTPAAPQAGGAITYTIALSNNGPGVASGVVLTDTLPSDVTPRGQPSFSVTQGSFAGGVWTVGSLNQGATATLRLFATVNNNSQGRTVVNSIEGLKSNTQDFDLTNNTDSVSFVVPGATQVRGLITNRATNQPISGALVELQDSASRLFSYTTAANGWYTFTSTITNPIAAGTAAIRASRTGFVNGSVNVAVVQGQSLRLDLALDTADLVVTKSDGATLVLPGQLVTYTLAITNVGSIPAATVVITDVLPPQITYLSDTLGITHSVPAANTYVWRLTTTINPNSVIRFRLRTQVANALPSPTFALTNLVRATTRTAEANTSNNVAQDTNASTGTVNPEISITVSPNQVKTNQNATYTIKLTNTGTAPVTSVVVEDTFSSFVDISSATTTKGTATTNSSTRKVTVTVDVLKPNETVTITVVVRVNATATTNQTVTNSASMKYTFGGTSFTRASNSVSFQILATSTLPGTGGIELPAAQPRIRAEVSAFSAAALTGILCLALIVFGIWARQRQPEWSRWAMKMGMLLGATAILFSVAGWGLYNYSASLQGEQASLQQEAPAPATQDPRLLVHTPEAMVWPDVLPQIPGSELDRLPDFPIPTPTLTAASQGESAPDTSPVNRIIIPALTLDTVVKYVPFDGITWMIAGLQQEVAWMGDTSWPGLGGNTALAGHVTLRTGVNGPFRYISNLQNGDSIFVHTEENIYEYRVREQNVVEATDLSILEPSQETKLTLITCTNFDPGTGFYTKRLAVTADLVNVREQELAARGN